MLQSNLNLKFICHPLLHQTQKWHHNPVVVSMTPREVYDISLATSFAVFSLSQYWKYPIDCNRKDVELYATLLALLWHIHSTFDPHVFILLWIVGGASHLTSKMAIGGRDNDTATRLHCGTHLSGHVVFILLLLDMFARR
jgi:hypothetical protein